MGFTKIFDSFGEMKGLIHSKKDLVVSSVIQKAGIEVNEEGSVAAAASGKSISRFSRAFDGGYTRKKKKKKMQT